MNFTTRALAIGTILLAATPLLATYPVDQQGTYTGTINGKNYATGTPVPVKGAATLAINSNSWQLELPNLTLNGTTDQMLLSSTNGMFLYNNANSGTHLHGCLHLKPSNGGMSIKAPILFQAESNETIIVNIEAKLSLKKQAP